MRAFCAEIIWFLLFALVGLGFAWLASPARAAPLDLDHRLIVCGSDGCHPVNQICVPEGCRGIDPLPQYICEAMVKSLKDNGIEAACRRVEPLPLS